MTRLLVLRAGALGDAVLTVPCLAGLRTRWPAAHITLVAPRAALPVLAQAVRADLALPFEGPAGAALYGPGIEPPAWAACDFAVVWLNNWQPVARTLRQWGIPQVYAGPSIPPEVPARHVGDALFDALGAIGVGLCCAWPAALTQPAFDAAALGWLQEAGWQRFVAVHPGSGGAHKCWPRERFTTLVTRLAGSGMPVLVSFGPAEEDDAARWQEVAASVPGVRCLRSPELPLLAALLRRCAAYVGNDSGVSHLAGVCGAPAVVLFGPTDPVRWAPRGPAVRVLVNAAAQPAGRQREVNWSLSVDEVLAATLQAVASPRN